MGWQRHPGMRVLGVFLLLSGALVAGCSDGGDGGAPDGLPEVRPTQEGKGAIGGVVVDEAIRPIAGALVTLAGLGMNVTTDESGTFAWPDLEPGSYFLVVSAPRYLPIQSSADVVAGETAFVRVQLVADPTPLPYQETVQFTGYMTAWAGIAQFFVEGSQDNGSALCDCRLYFTPRSNLSTVVYEAYWDWTVPDPANQAELYYVVEQIEGDAYEEGYCFSPCIVHIGGDSFTPDVQAYARLDGPDFWFAYQQQFELFVTLFYHGEAPDGWSLAGA
jgi:hypothetical protein